MKTLRNNEQEVMIGYSDSGKDAGRLAAAWGLYEGQEKAGEVAKEFGVHLTLFPAEAVQLAEAVVRRTLLSCRNREER